MSAGNLAFNHCEPYSYAMAKPRDLSVAVTLRPAEVYALYGIASSTLHSYCTRQENPLPSILIRGKSGRKGVRLIERKAIDAWLAQWRV